MFKEISAYLLLTKIGRIVLLILLGCIVVTYFFIGSNLFLVKEIDILNSDLVDVRSFSRWKGKNIFLLPVDTLREKIDEIPEVKSIVIKKELPHKLTVEIQEYIPCAFLSQSTSIWSKLTGESTKTAISKEGVVFLSKEKASEISNYPLVIYEKRNDKEDFPMGDPLPGLEEAISAYISIKDTVPIEIIKVKKDNEIFLYIKNTKTEIRMNSEDYEKEADYLKILMKELPSKNVEYIDLRFGKDVVVKP